MDIAAPIREARRVNPEAMKEAILQLCNGRFLSIQEMAQLLNRKADTLRNHYIITMMEGGQLMPIHPNVRNHPQQKYTAAENG